MKKDQTASVKKTEQCYPVTRGELRLLEKEMGMFLQASLKEPERWKETIRSLSVRGFTECSIVMREKAFPLEDVF